MEKIYYYECLSCGTVFKQKQRFAAPAYTEQFCTHCGHTCKVRRLICKTSFILKGRSWARDSYGLQERIVK